MTRILIIEDEESYREALTYMLNKEGFDVAAEADGESGLAEYDRNGADLVLLDLMLPGMPGTEVCRRLRARGNVAIIMVSARDSETDKVVGLEIRAILRRGHDSTLISEIVEMDGVRIDVERHQVVVDGQEVRLALREFELLELLLRNAGRVMTRGQIIDRIWGSDYVGDTKTLDVHVKRLRNKIERDPSSPSRVITVRGLGYKFQG